MSQNSSQGSPSNSTRNNVPNEVYPKAQTRALRAHLAAKSEPKNDLSANVEAMPRAQVAALDKALASSQPPQPQKQQNIGQTPLGQTNASTQVTAYPRKELDKLGKFVATNQPSDDDHSMIKPVQQVKALGQALAISSETSQNLVIAPKPIPDESPVPVKLIPAKVTEELQADIEPKKAFSKMAAKPPSRPQANIQPKPVAVAAPSRPSKPTTAAATSNPASKPFALTNPFKLPKFPKIPNPFGKKPGVAKPDKPDATTSAPDKASASDKPDKPSASDKPDKPDKPGLFSRLFGKKQESETSTAPPERRPSISQQQQQQQPEPLKELAEQKERALKPNIPSLPRALPASYPPRTRGIADADDSPDRQRGYPRISAMGEDRSANFSKSGNEFGLNEPSTSARFFDKTRSALFADPLDPKRLEQIIKEFQRFAANLASVSTSMINNLKMQTTNFRSLVAKTDERRRNDLYTNFLSTLERILDRYMQLHKVFLIDNNFSKKMQYAWQYAPDVTQQQVDAFTKNVIDPYFANIAELTANAMPKHMVGGASPGTNVDKETSSPGVYYAYEKYMERLGKEREKLYDFYYNKASNTMLQWTSTHTLIYSMKLLRMLFLWMALYLTSKTFQARYVQKVFADNEDPPRLEYFVLMFWALEAVLMVFVFIILYLIKYLLNSDSNFILNDGVIGKFLGDYIASTVLIVLAGLVIGNIMMKKKYFRYKSDGLRAIRSFEEVMWYISIFILAFPFFVIF